jgi:hypothetical protein
VCLGATLAACAASGGGGGYVALGGTGRTSPAAVTPTGSVTLVPLDGTRDGTATGGGNSPSNEAGSATGGAKRSTPEHPSGPGAGTASASPDPTGGAGGRTTPDPASPTATPGAGKAPAPADLSWGDPATAGTDARRCQKVTVAFHNSGGTAVRSGTVTFGTHIIGALGIDWGTVSSTVDLPVPIAPGAHTKPTWTVCVDAWRVPLGMHIETRDVSVQWK